MTAANGSNSCHPNATDDTKVDTKVNPKVDAKVNTKADAKVGTEVDAKPRAKADTESNTKIESSECSKPWLKCKAVLLSVPWMPGAGCYFE